MDQLSNKEINNIDITLIGNFIIKIRFENFGEPLSKLDYECLEKEAEEFIKRCDLFKKYADIEAKEWIEIFDPEKFEAIFGEVK